MHRDFSIEIQKSSGCSLEMRYRPWHTLSYYPKEVSVKRVGPMVRSDKMQARHHLALYPAGIAERTIWSDSCEAMHLHLAPLSIADCEGNVLQLERRDPVEDPQLLAAMQAIYEECRGAGEGDRSQLPHLVNEVRGHLARSTRAPRVHRSIGIKTLDDIIGRMLDPSSIGIGRRELASSCRVSATYFNRRFGALFGCSPHDYLLNTRVELAKCHIFKGETSLAEIALATGFCDQAHLARQFRRRTGMTAGQFRRHFER